MNNSTADEHTPEPEHTATVTASSSGRDHSTRFLMGWSILAVILVMGVIVSVVVAVRGDEEGPLVPAGDTDTGATAASTQDQFEPDPFFDELGRVVYIPRSSDNGVLLPQSTPPAGRDRTTPPSGMMLQRVHGNMYLPFSTSDGPTGFTANGVATGFARTPQGAILAAVHYSNYLTTGNDRIAMLQAAGRVEDTAGVIAAQNDVNTALDYARGGAADSSPGRPLPMATVVFTDNLSRVWLGTSMRTATGEVKNYFNWYNLVWRDGTGWVMKFDASSWESTGTIKEFAASAGWVKWW